MRKFRIIFMFLFLFSNGICFASGKVEDLQLRIIDAETGMPVEGLVVSNIIRVYYFSFPHYESKWYLDQYVTDSNGEVTIPEKKVSKHLYEQYIIVNIDCHNTENKASDLAETMFYTADYNNYTFTPNKKYKNVSIKYSINDYEKDSSTTLENLQEYKFYYPDDKKNHKTFKHDKDVLEIKIERRKDETKEFRPTVTIDDKQYYQLSTAEDLYWFYARCDVYKDRNINAILTADIKINENVVVNGELNEQEKENFKPWKPFWLEGTFDGNGHTISGLYCDKRGQGYSAFISVLSNGTVKNLGIIDSYFSGNDNIGSICSNISRESVIENCWSNSLINGVWYTGGICGHGYSDFLDSEGVSILNCQFTGKVTGEKYAGGIIGYLTSYKYTSKIVNCTNSGDVSGKTQVDGICGEYNSEYVIIENCVNTGTIIISKEK